MITHVECIPRTQMELIANKIFMNLEYAAISIIDPDMCPVFPRDTERLKTFYFSDIEPSPYLKSSWLIGSRDCFMNTEQARGIVSHIRDLAISETKYKLFINCSAGICRSGAIGQFAQAFSTMKDVHFASVNMHIHPNRWVFNKLIEVWTEEFSDLKTIQEEEEF